MTAWLARLTALVLVSAPPMAAQQAPSDSTDTELRSTLRAFYFDLRHHDWEALSASILPAKVVAHLRPPDPLSPGAASPSSACAPASAPQVERAVITLDGDWADAAVPRCALAGVDQFRFVRFGPRWWIVHIELFKGPGEVELAR